MCVKLDCALNGEHVKAGVALSSGAVLALAVGVGEERLLAQGLP